MFPRFLVIGGQKCGTTWLQDCLQTHPQVWLPPTKEVHYLDRGDVPLFKRLFSTTKRMRKARAYAFRQLRARLSGAPSDDLRWALSYWLEHRDDDWYGRLFPDDAGTVPGEICPGYARLDALGVARVKALMPDTRIVYLLRNPIDRSWSYAAQYFSSPRGKGRYGSLAAVPEQVLMEFLKKDASGHSDYLAALDAWQAQFSGDRMLLGYFDELQENPVGLYVRILDFLGLNAAPEVIPDFLHENRHGSRGSKAPAKFRAFLASLHVEGLEKLHARLQTDVTRKWHDEALGLLSPGNHPTVAPVHQ